MKRLTRALALFVIFCTIFCSLTAVATDKAKALYKQGLDAEVRGDTKRPITFIIRRTN